VAGRGRIDGFDGGVGVGAAQHRRIQHIREREIVEKRALAGEQSRIFKPFQRLACVSHWGLLSVCQSGGEKTFESFNQGVVAKA
jgi:hypothetical protein